MTNEKLIASHLIYCRGVQSERASSGLDRQGEGLRLPVHDARMAEPVVINIYEDGSSEILCRHFDREDDSCTAGQHGRYDICPYRRK